MKRTKCYYTVIDKDTKKEMRIPTKEFVQKKKNSVSIGNFVQIVEESDLENDNGIFCSSAGIVLRAENDLVYCSQTINNNILTTTFLGGKREYIEESSFDIAIREFTEETFCSLGATKKNKAEHFTKTRKFLYNSVKKGVTKVWLADCKYFVFVIDVLQDNIDSVLTDEGIAAWTVLPRYEDCNITTHPVVRSFVTFIKNI